MSVMSDVYIALGSNLGDRVSHLREAADQLGALPRTEIAARSAVYETEPIGPVEQGPFLNAAVKLTSELEPLALLHHLQVIEREAGRLREGRWGPRTLDLDLLLYDDRIVSTNELILPHPRLHERRFVLQPLCDIAPNVIHPSLDEPMCTLLDRSPPMKMQVEEMQW